MTKWIIPLSIALMVSTAHADATAEARAHSEKFAKACEAGEVGDVLALYTDDARVVWPGAGEEAQGKVAIEKLVKGFCDPKTNVKMTLKSIEGIALDSDHIATVGMWDVSFKGPDGKMTTAHGRTTEVLQKAGAGWQYVVDHASIGMPPPKPATAAHKPAAKKM